MTQCYRTKEEAVAGFERIADFFGSETCEPMFQKMGEGSSMKKGKCKVVNVL